MFINWKMTFSEGLLALLVLMILGRGLEADSGSGETLADWIPGNPSSAGAEEESAASESSGKLGKSERAGREWTTTGSTGSYYPPTNAYVGGPNYVDSYGVPHSEYTYPNPAPAPAYSSEEVKAKQRPIQVPPIFPSVYSGMPMTPAECQMAGYSNFFSDIVRVGGLVKVGLIKAGLTALAAGLLTKLPILLFIKTLIVKLIIFPIGFIIFSLPVLLPLLLFFLPNLLKDKQPIMMMMSPDANNSTLGQNVKKPGTRDFLYRVSEGEKGYEVEYEDDGRDFKNSGDPSKYLDAILSNLFDTQSCLQRLACQLGARDANSKYRKSVSWALKYLQTLKIAESSSVIQARLKSYRNAYNLGAEQNSTEFCISDNRYPCEPPHLVIQQSKRSFTLI